MDCWDSWQPLDIRVDILLANNGSNPINPAKIYNVLHPLIRIKLFYLSNM